MDFQLQIVRGRGASTTIKLADGVTTVGRQDDCQLRIKSSQVSRRHCELFEKKGILLVKDLGSSNGTFVNGKKVQDQRVLEPGDELTIGGILLKVAKIGQAPPQTPAASGPKPGDTAVVETIPTGDDDEFEIEFDIDLPEPETFPTAGEVQKDASVASPDEVEPVVDAKTEPKGKSAKKAEPEPEPDKLLGDDAIADFLLDIKFDED